jgi:hypothetical protein
MRVVKSGSSHDMFSAHALSRPRDGRSEGSRTAREAGEMSSTDAAFAGRWGDCLVDSYGWESVLDGLVGKSGNVQD